MTDMNQEEIADNSFLGHLIFQGMIDKTEADRVRSLTPHELINFLSKEKRITEREILGCLARYFDLEIKTTIQDKELQPSLLKDLSIQFLKKTLLLPLQATKRARTGQGNSASTRKENDSTVAEQTISLACCDPFNLAAQDLIKKTLSHPLTRLVLTPKNELLRAIGQAYGQMDSGSEAIVKDIQDENGFSVTELAHSDSQDLLEDTSDTPVIKLVNHILAQGVRHKASDIHIEPYQSSLKIRLRVDGVLYNFLDIPAHIHPALVSRIKILARLNIAEKRKPQDGRIQIRVGERSVDLRVSTMPTGFGERVVLRLLEKDIRILDLSELGLGTDHLNILKKLINISHGIILVTGPTGSGKTTTLYSALNEINTEDKNILTIEDPIEYQLDGIGQTQVNPKIGLTFATGLRSMVRQDPDVILVGEIRDLETAEIAIQAALTGHLVFSTLHTNDASSAITRLIDMGIEPFLVSSAVKAILAQRLIRVLCPGCKKPIPREHLDLSGLAPGEVPDHYTLYQPAGCDHCLQTGYKGRTGIFEFLTMGEEVQSLILKTSEANIIKKKAISLGMHTLRQDGLAKAFSGITSLDEILRVTQE